ncbi:MAG: hypothetical protein ACOY9D_05160 [Pseudomonadota bacterium]
MFGTKKEALDEVAMSVLMLVERTLLDPISAWWNDCSANTLYQTPCFDHHPNRWYTVFHSPNSGGRSCHGAPLRSYAPSGYDEKSEVIFFQPENRSCHPVHASIRLAAQGTQYERSGHQLGESPFDLSSPRSGRVERQASFNCSF